MLRAKSCHDHLHLRASRRLILVQTWSNAASSPSACKANTTSFVNHNLIYTAAIEMCTQSPSKLSLDNNRSFSTTTDGAVEEVGKRMC